MLASLFTFILQFVCILGGATTLYVAMFAYEREERLLQDALEEWWIGLQDVERSLWEHTKRITTAGAEISAIFIDHWLGPKILSIRFLTIATVSSFGSAALMIGLFFPSKWSMLFIPVAVFFIWRAFLPIRTNKPPYIAAGLAVLLFILPLGNYFISGFRIYSGDWYHVLIVALLFSILANAYAVGAVRTLMRYLGKRAAVIFILSMPLLTCMGIVVISILSMLLLGPFSWIAVPVMSLPAIILSFLPSVLLAIFFMLVVLAHLFGRGLYSAQRHRIVHDKKMLWSLSLLQFSAVPFGRLLASFFGA